MDKVLNKLTVFGASGRTGRIVVNLALQQGWLVTAFLRQGSLWEEKHPRLHVVTGDVLRLEEVEGAVSDQDIIVSALGIAKHSTSSICSEGMRTILGAMRPYAGMRLLAISEASVKETINQMPLLGRWVIRLLLDNKAIQDKERMEQLIKSSNTAWTIIRPPFLTGGPLTTTYQAGTDVKLNLISSVSRANLADCILKLASDNSSIRKAVLIRE